MARPFGTFKYRTEQELKTAIDKYFSECEAKPVLDDEGNQITDKHGNPMFYPSKPPVSMGLCKALGITPQTLINYAENDDYFETVRDARMRLLQYKEERLYDKDGVQGAKFDLGNNSERMGGLSYSDKQEISYRDDTPLPDADTLKAQLRALLDTLTDDEKAAIAGGEDG